MTEDRQCINHAGHSERLKSIETACAELNANTRLIVQGQHELRERVAQVESSTKSSHHRLDNMERLTDAIVCLTGEVKEISMDTKAILQRMEQQEKRTDTHEQRISKIEDAPGVIAVKGWMFVGGIVVTGLLGFIMGKFGI